jgi:hypothetical protein
MKFYKKINFYFIIIVIIIISNCVSKPMPKKEIIIKIKSEIPVSVSVYKSCKDSWNFCKWQ